MNEEKPIKKNCPSDINSGFCDNGLYSEFDEEQCKNCWENKGGEIKNEYCFSSA